MVGVVVDERVGTGDGLWSCDRRGAVICSKIALSIFFPRPKHSSSPENNHQFATLHPEFVFAGAALTPWS